MLEDLLRPLQPEDFFRNFWTREFLHIPGDPAKFIDLFSWDVLNLALETHRFYDQRLRLFKSGKKIDSDRFLNGPCVDAGKLTNELSNGATLILNSCEEIWPPLRKLCVHLEWLFHTRVVVNLYAGWRRDNGFAVHWDDQDNLILQVTGRKHWKVWNPTHTHPFKEDTVDTSTPPTGDPVWDGVLEAGGLLSIPRGFWHVAYPVDEPSLHLTVTVPNLTGIGLLHWLADRMKSSEAARMALPLMAPPEQRAAWLDRVRADLSAAWDETVLDQYLADVDAKAPPRPRLLLPGDADPRASAIKRTTAIEIAIPRPLRFFTQDGKTWCGASGFKWQMDSDVAAKIKVFNDRCPHTMNELSPVKDLRLSALIGTMVMNGVLRRVSDSAVSHSGK